MTTRQPLPPPPQVDPRPLAILTEGTTAIGTMAIIGYVLLLAASFSILAQRFLSQPYNRYYARDVASSSSEHDNDGFYYGDDDELYDGDDDDLYYGNDDDSYLARRDDFGSDDLYRRDAASTAAASKGKEQGYYNNNNGYYNNEYGYELGGFPFGEFGFNPFTVVFGHGYPFGGYGYRWNGQNNDGGAAAAAAAQTSLMLLFVHCTNSYFPRVILSLFLLIPPCLHRAHQPWETPNSPAIGESWENAFSYNSVQKLTCSVTGEADVFHDLSLVLF